ncbi:hypothetical protein [Bacillus cereus]|uniref:hypothetical protein n=1 Tax=Bacillus cereus TaxID=1396 RepID=UPI000BF5B582|nr:hypothetical protein [Bacillus cereus]PFO85769.1 hypothetical protein COJ89_26840 [Bacillus cereus]PGN41840.1 hypothetical protein CN962_27590 [Bacillus cereus]PGQ61953.1 hypothetical protein COA21_29570 [Bacillus cereus]PGY68814.1 hypothetical protein COE42_23365 [Bacillus cereus]
MNNNVEKKFFKENPKAYENWFVEFTENAIKKCPPYLKELLEEKYKIAKPILDEQYTWFSNDLFLHHIMYNLINDANEEIKGELEKVWIGKLDDKLEATAIARTIDPDFSGYLITLNFEMEYLLCNVCEALAGELLICTHKDEKYKKLMTELYITNFMSLPEQNERAIFIREELPSVIDKKISDFFSLAYIGATTFVIAHEIGHHFLKHTEVDSVFIKPYRDMYIRGGNINHEFEYAADDFAIDLMMQNKSNLKIEYLAGPYLVMLALALVDPTPQFSCDSHPSIKDRFENIKQRIALNYKDEEVVETLIALTNRVTEFINISAKPERWKGREWWK